MMKLGIIQYSDKEADRFQLLFTIYNDEQITTTITKRKIESYTNPYCITELVSFRYEV